MIKKLTKLVRAEMIENDWKYHVSLVVKYAKRLAKIKHENVKIAEIAALLHDIGGFKYGWKNHEKTGAKEAEKILTRLNFSPDIIKEVKICIESHRTSGRVKPKTKLAEILRDADALAHFDAVPWLISIGLYRLKNLEKTIVWVRNKLENDYKHKLHLPESKKIAAPKYRAAMTILKI
ncbi:MAG: HD domain-containing protein [Patescibacteria group bacterium]